MGTCCSSSGNQPVSLSDDVALNSAPNQDGGQPSQGIGLKEIEVDGPLTSTEINNRIEQCECQTIKMDHCTIRYAYVSQRGYYPDDLNKANQKHTYPLCSDMRNYTGNHRRPTHKKKATTA